VWDGFEIRSNLPRPGARAARRQRWRFHGTADQSLKETGHVFLFLAAEPEQQRSREAGYGGATEAHSFLAAARSAGGPLTFAPGETTKTITITVNGDSKKEAGETFYLDLFGLSGNSLFTKNRGLCTILNDD
jgi:hypothetical protein